MDEQSIVRAIAGSSYVVHIALILAVSGMDAVLNACKAAKVRRLVITSSVSAVQSMAKTDKPANCTFNESHWSNPDKPEGTSGYVKSKTLAERAAWDFIARLPEN